MELEKQLALLRSRLEEKYPEIFGTSEDCKGLFTFKEVESLWQKEGRFIPFSQFVVALTTHRIHDLQIEGSEKAKAILQMAEALGAKDAVTQLHGTYSQVLNHDLADYYTRTHPATHIYYIHADLNNLRGINLILSEGAVIGSQTDAHGTKEGHRLTNFVLHMIAKIFREELKSVVETGRGDKDYGPQFYRVGGDEFTAMLVGDKEHAEKINMALKRINTKVDALVKDLGLGNVMHPKDIGNLGKRGTGLTCVAGEYLPAPIETLESYRANNEDFEFVMDSRMKTARAERIAQMRLTDMPPIDDDYHVKGMDIAFDAEQRKEVERKINEKATNMGGREILKKIPSFPFHGEGISKRVPGHALKKFYLWPSMKQAWQLQAVDARLGFDGKESELLRGLYKIYQVRDVLTGYRRDASLKPVLENIITHLQHNPASKPMVALTFEMQNFGGLNDRGHGWADRHAGEIMRLIENSTEKYGHHSLIFRPRGRGDRVNVLLGEGDQPAIQKLIRDIIYNVHEYTKEHNLHYLTNPRHDDEESVGVRFVVGASMLQPIPSKPLSGTELKDMVNAKVNAIMDSIDDQVKNNKAKHICFDGHVIGIDETIYFDRTEEGKSFFDAETKRRSVNDTNMLSPI